MARDLPRLWRAPITDRLRYPAETVEHIRALSHTQPDEQVAKTLNMHGVPSSRGKPFASTMVKRVRYRYAIRSARLQRSDEVTVKQPAGELGASIHFVHYWIKSGKIAAGQIDGRGPWWITIDALQRSNLHDQIRNSRHFKKHHCKAQL